MEGQLINYHANLVLQCISSSIVAALRRSKKRVRAVIQTELPLLISRELSHNQENDPYVTRISDPNSSAEMHKARWNALFSQMEKALSEEEIQLVSTL